jgi:hypothetical protein
MDDDKQNSPKGQSCDLPFLLLKGRQAGIISEIG